MQSGRICVAGSEMRRIRTVSSLYRKGRALASGASGGNPVQVQVLSSALEESQGFTPQSVTLGFPCRNGYSAILPHPLVRRCTGVALPQGAANGFPPEEGRFLLLPVP